MVSTQELLREIAEEAKGIPAHYGVQLWIDEDEELWALGHHPRRRLLAAARSFMRREYGGWAPVAYELHTRMLRTAPVRELWVAWDRDAERLPEVPAGTPGAVPLTEVVL